MQLLPRPRTRTSLPSPHPNAMQMHGRTEPLGSWDTTDLGRVMVFIDAANLFYAANHLSLEIDYVKLLPCLTRGRSLVRAYFYTGVDPTNKKQQNFLLWMRHHGYRVVAKDLIQQSDGSRKANLEVEMAIDMLNLANYCETVILLSGNGELSYAVSKVADQGVQIEIVSLPTMLNDSLRSIADRFIDLTSLQPQIQKGGLPPG